MANGRRSNLVAQAPDRQEYGIGVDLGRTHVRVLIGSSLDRVVDENVVTLKDRHGVAETIELIARLVDEGCERTGLDRGRITGLAMGVPGPVDVRTGAVTGGSILPGWGHVPLRDIVSEGLGCPAVIENDANLGAVALQRVYDTSDGLAFIKIGTGVGAGIVLDGRLWRGGAGTTGEIGHLTVDPRLALVCRCGRRGCLETIGSTEAVRHAIAAATDRAVTVDEAIKLIEARDPVALAALRDAADALGRGLGLLAMTVNPRRIVIGGPLARAGDALLAPVQRAFESAVMPRIASFSEISICPLGERAEALGALVRAMEIDRAASV
ncbi:ROK family protein [Mumia sp. ZJ1417]|uniref:ROK family protein n=2 Tax=Mumia TaxID=1546255 RepID=UPI0014226D5E|nr:ROK family protein [Mumia sp. ZJ1417]QMW66745.1 ROK family protein [Mumia sp. ZJ1417]